MNNIDLDCYPTAFHSMTHCIVCGATYETCVCEGVNPDELDNWDLDSWDLDTYDGMEEVEEDTVPLIPDLTGSKQ